MKIKSGMHLQALSMESQPQNPEFRNHPENFLPCVFTSPSEFPTGELRIKSGGVIASTKKKLIREATLISLIQHFEADFLWKFSFKMLNSGLILKTFSHTCPSEFPIGELRIKSGGAIASTKATESVLRAPHSCNIASLMRRGGSGPVM